MTPWRLTGGEAAGPGTSGNRLEPDYSVLDDSESYKRTGRKDGHDREDIGSTAVVTGVVKGKSWHAGY